MASYYASAEEIALQSFVDAAEAGPGSLQACWNDPARSYGIDDAAVSTAWSPTQFGSSENALQRAASCGNNESIEWLIAHGAKLDVVDNDGRTPLLLAMQSQKWETAEKLLQLGATPWAATGPGRYGGTVTSQSALLFAFSSSARAAEFLAAHGLVPSQDQLTATAGNESYSLLSTVTDCQRGGLKRPRPPLHELLPLMRLASRHVTAAQHYALCDAPLVCNATLDGAIVYLTGAGADGTGSEEDVRALCVPNSRLLTERSRAIAQALAGVAHPQEPPAASFARWVCGFHSVSERMLPAAMVAVWGSRCPAMRFVARLCGASPTETPGWIRHEVFPGAPASGGGILPLRMLGQKCGVHELNEGALLAAVSACQVGGTLHQVSNAQNGESAHDVTPAAVRMLAIWAASVLLYTVRQLRVAAVGPDGSAEAHVARDALAFFVGDTVASPAASDGPARPHLRATPVEQRTRVMSADGAAGLLQHARQERRLVNQTELRPSMQRWSYCMSHADMGALLGFATWRLRRGVVLRRVDKK